MAECDQSTTLDELSDWILDEENQVNNDTHTALSQHIDQCPVCSQRINSLRQLNRLTRDLMEQDLEEQSQDTSWLTDIMNNIVFETRAGRAIPLATEFEHDSITVTEGAVISAVRVAADALDDVLIGKCRLQGDIETLGAPVIINITAALRSDLDEAESADNLRELVATELTLVSELNIEEINIRFTEFFEKSDDSDESNEE